MKRAGGKEKESRTLAQSSYHYYHSKILVQNTDRHRCVYNKSAVVLSKDSFTILHVYTHKIYKYIYRKREGDKGWFKNKRAEDGRGSDFINDLTFL